MRFLALALLLASPVFGQTAISDMQFADLTISSPSAEDPAENWADNMVGVYDFEASGDPWMNDVDSAGGSGCDMTIGNGTPTRDVVTYKEGTAAGFFEDSGGENEYIATTCTDLDEDVDDADWSWGGWVYADLDNTGTFVGYESAGTGYQLSRDSSQDRAKCTANAVSVVGDADDFEIDTWTHIACVYDHSTTELDIIVNGVDTAVSAATTSGLTARDGRIGGALGEQDKYSDEVFFYSGELLPEDACRIASCRMDGSLCTCNGTSWVDDGDNDGIGGGDITCTLPTNCNEAAP